MAVTVFKDTSYSLGGLLERIDHGEIALPDIQRPFVWSNARVRDLFDSMYKGFPVGYLLLWSTGADIGTKQIGVDKKQTVPSLLIVDGQQRLTSLFAVITGTPIIRKDYSEARIRVAFNPDTQVFDVTDAAIENNPEFIPDISTVFQGSFLTFVNKYLSRLEEYRDGELDDSEKDRLVENIDRLKDLQNYPFQAIELDRTVEEEHVADVFVRINSEGVKLNNTDFILTLMSVFREKGRKELETFCRSAKKPSTGSASPFNHFIEPSPDQLLRTAVGVAFKRGRLKFVYSILRGKDLETGNVDSDRGEQQFAALDKAQKQTLDLNNWHEYLKCLQRAGFRSSRMISSETALVYVYIIWLIGRQEYNVDLKRLREVIARWWFMAHATGRYTGSSESQIEADLNRIKNIPKNDADKFCDNLDRIVRDTFSTDYWQITLPNRLDTSSAKSPPLSAYWAALNILEAEALFSNIKISAMLDPVITPVKDMERHHLFPRNYLKGKGIVGLKQVNAIANMSFIDWSDNLAISDRAPSEYWPVFSKTLGPDKLKQHAYWHALPLGWEQLEYEEFCEKRRSKISDVVKDGFNRLWQSDTPTPSKTLISDVIAYGESNSLEFKESARWSHGTEKKGKSEHIIVKTVSGFMNSEGGTLLIGVADDGRITGIEVDYATMSKANRDRYELFLTQLIEDKISGPSQALCRIEFHQIDGKDICQINVASSAKAVFTCPHNSKKPTEFWLRQGNRTAQLHGTELAEYIEEHWG